MASMSGMPHDIDRDRAERMAANAAAMASLGLDVALGNMLAARAPAVPKKPRVKAVVSEPAAPSRRSERERAVVSYVEDAAYAGLPRLTRGPSAPRHLDDAEIERMRSEKMQASTSAAAADGDAEARRKALDSGRGVRVQGGKVYDSAYGVTCHWCRQKTLESSVTCCNSACGGGKRLPSTFCAKCLLNRHGEDFQAARASGLWECPQCRGSCGPGCTRCCNCGPCRKKAGLEPTRQIIGEARSEGFNNVHDYLVHLKTGESAEVIARRKSRHPWGDWLSGKVRQALPAAQVAAAAGAQEDEQPVRVRRQKKQRGRTGGVDANGGEADEQPAEPAAGKKQRKKQQAAADDGEEHEGRAAPKGRKRPAKRSRLADPPLASASPAVTAPEEHHPKTASAPVGQRPRKVVVRKGASAADTLPAAVAADADVAPKQGVRRRAKSRGGATDAPPASAPAVVSAPATAVAPEEAAPPKQVASRDSKEGPTTDANVADQTEVVAKRRNSAAKRGGGAATVVTQPEAADVALPSVADVRDDAQLDKQAVQPLRKRSKVAVAADLHGVPLAAVPLTTAGGTDAALEPSQQAKRRGAKAVMSSGNMSADETTAASTVVCEVVLKVGGGGKAKANMVGSEAAATAVSGVVGALPKVLAAAAASVPPSRKAASHAKGSSKRRGQLVAPLQEVVLAS